MSISKTSIQQILLIDDDRDDCLIFEHSLREVAPDVSLITIHHYEEVTAAVDVYMPDLIFLDINMPIIDGIHILKTLQSNKRFAHIPIIMISGVSDMRYINESYDSGAFFFMKKPSSYTDSIENIYNILSKVETHLQQKVVA